MSLMFISQLLRSSLFNWQSCSLPTRPQKVTTSTYIGKLEIIVEQTVLLVPPIWLDCFCASYYLNGPLSNLMVL